MANSASLSPKGDEVLERGYLTESGSPVPAARLSSVGLDPEGTPLEKETVLYDGEERELLPSSFDEAADLTEADLTALVGFCVTDVYPLEGTGLAKGLMGLGQEITKATGGRMKLDRSTENLLAFNANGSGTAAQGDAKPEEKKWYQFWD